MSASVGGEFAGTAQTWDLRIASAIMLPFNALEKLWHYVDLASSSNTGGKTAQQLSQRFTWAVA